VRPPSPRPPSQFYEGGYRLLRAPDEHGGGYTLYALQFHAKDTIVVLGPPNNNNEDGVGSPTQYVASHLIPYDGLLEMGPNKWYNANPNSLFNWGSRAAMTLDCANDTPNQFHPHWYFLNHAPTRTADCQPTAVRANLKVKLEWVVGTEIVEGQPVVKRKKMPVFVATEDIQIGAPLAYSYAEHPWAWCGAPHCLGCTGPVVEDLTCDESLSNLLDDILGVDDFPDDLMDVPLPLDVFDIVRQSPVAVTEALVVDPVEDYDLFADSVFAYEM
jgi:hypothetical protein